jgi:hypothetical protein
MADNETAGGVVEDGFRRLSVLSAPSERARALAYYIHMCDCPDNDLACRSVLALLNTVLYPPQMSNPSHQQAELSIDISIASLLTASRKIIEICSYSNDVEMLRAGAKGLVRMTEVPGRRREIANQGAGPALVRLLTSADDDEVTASAAQALAHFAKDFECAKEVSVGIVSGRAPPAAHAPTTARCHAHAWSRSRRSLRSVHSSATPR